MITAPWEHGERRQSRMDNCSCANCKHRDGIRCKQHTLILDAKQIMEFTCDDYTPDLIMQMDEFDDQMRIAEIERL